MSLLGVPFLGWWETKRNTDARVQFLTPHRLQLSFARRRPPGRRRRAHGADADGKVCRPKGGPRLHGHGTWDERLGLKAAGCLRMVKSEFGESELSTFQGDSLKNIAESAHKAPQRCSAKRKGTTCHCMAVDLPVPHGHGCLQLRCILKEVFCARPMFWARFAAR